MKKVILLILLIVSIVSFAFSQTITITNPHSGDTWYKGNTYTITWTKSGSMNANVKIRLMQNGQKILGITDSTPNNGSFSWTIPSSVTPGTYYIRVKTIDNAVFDDGDTFTISNAPSASITVTSPRSGDIWYKGSTNTIRWTKSGSMNANVKIRLYQGSTRVLEITDSTANDGSFNWTVPNSLSEGTYYIRVKTIDNTVYDNSDTFRIIKRNEVTPDFELKRISVNGNPTGDKLNFLKVSIVNNGDSYEGMLDFRIVGMDKFMGGKFQLDTKRSFNVKIGRGERFSRWILRDIKWPIDVCNVVFSVKVDPDNKIAERNEKNNYLEKRIYKGEVLGEKFCDIMILPHIIKIGKAALRSVPDEGSIVLAHSKNDIFLTLRNNCSEIKTWDFSIVYGWALIGGENKVIWHSKITLNPCEVRPMRISIKIPKRKEFKTLALRSLHYYGSQAGYSVHYKINVKVDF